MRKACFLIGAFVFINLNLFSQSERIDENYISQYKMEEFCRNNQSLVKSIFKETGEKNENEAIKAGWASFAEVFGLEAMPIGFVSEVFAPKSLERINKAMGNIGIGLVLTQLAIDFSNGDYNKGAMSFSKSTMFYVFGTYGWKALKISSFGLQFLDYSLSKLGNAGVSARVVPWSEAYKEYYKHGGGKRNLKDWQNVFENAKSSDDIKEMIDNHISEFWDKPIRASYLEKKTVGIGYSRLDPTPKEKKEIQDAYLKYDLLPYLKSLFLRMPVQAKKKKLEELADKYRQIKIKLNKRNTVVVNAKSQVGIFDDTHVYIKANVDGEFKTFMHQKTDEKGQCFFEFTRYSLLLHKVKKDAMLLIKCKSENGVVSVKHKLDLSRKQNFILYEIPENKVDSSANLKKSEQTALRFFDNMTAVFTIQKKTMDVVIKRISETPSHFYGQIIRKGFFKENKLVYDKRKKELSIVYKLKGRWAPELICTPDSFANNTFSGLIKTNDKHAVKVGKFTFKLSDDK